MPRPKSLQLVVDNINHTQPGTSIPTPDVLLNWFRMYGFRPIEQCSFYGENNLYVPLYMWESYVSGHKAFEYVTTDANGVQVIWAKLQATAAPIQINLPPPLEIPEGNNYITSTNNMEI